jgi:hypothetical protein
MSETQTPPPEGQSPLVTRAEELLDRLGRRFAETRKRVSENLERQAQAAHHSTGNGATPTARAEEIVDRVGQRIGYFGVLAGHQLRKFAARVREEAEDMLAEAQTMRQRQPPAEPTTPPAHEPTEPK